MVEFPGVFRGPLAVDWLPMLPQLKLITGILELVVLYSAWRLNWGDRLLRKLYAALTEARPGPSLDVGPRPPSDSWAAPLLRAIGRKGATRERGTTVERQPSKFRRVVREFLRQSAISLTLLRGAPWTPQLVLQRALMTAIALFSFQVLLIGVDGFVGGLVALLWSVLIPPWALALINLVLYPVVGRRAYERQVPEALMIMSEEVRVGRSLEQAVYRVLQHLGEPLRTEFGRVQLRATAGAIPMEQLLLDLADHGRFPNRDLEMAAVCLMATKPLGGDVAKLLGDLAATVHRRHEIEMEIAHILAAGRVSALMLTGIISLAELAILIVLPLAFSGGPTGDGRRIWDYYDGRTWLLGIGFLFTMGVVLSLRVLARRA